GAAPGGVRSRSLPRPEPPPPIGFADRRGVSLSRPPRRDQIQVSQWPRSPICTEGGEPAMSAPISASARQELDGQVAIVTGGGRGFGRSFAEGLAAAGAAVAVVARTDEQIR